MHVLKRGALLAVVLTALAGVGSASAAIAVAYDAQRPALRVDAAGNAEVSWTAGGVRRYLFVPPTGRVYPGRRLAGADVSRTSRRAGDPVPRVRCAARPTVGCGRSRPGGSTRAAPSSCASRAGAASRRS